MIVPSRSRSGRLLLVTQVSLPSGQVSRSSLSSIGIPLAMICCSSAKAALACSAVYTSKSVSPRNSSGSKPRLAANARLTAMNLLWRSL
jgi:hypothetical protein